MASSDDILSAILILEAVTKTGVKDSTLARRLLAACRAFVYRSSPLPRRPPVPSPACMHPWTISFSARTSFYNVYVCRKHLVLMIQLICCFNFSQEVPLLIPDVIPSILAFVDDLDTLRSISLVCRAWYFHCSSAISKFKANMEKFRVEVIVDLTGQWQSHQIKITSLADLMRPRVVRHFFQELVEVTDPYLWDRVLEPLIHLAIKNAPQGWAKSGLITIDKKFVPIRLLCALFLQTCILRFET